MSYFIFLAGCQYFLSLNLESVNFYMSRLIKLGLLNLGGFALSPLVVYIF